MADGTTNGLHRGPLLAAGVLLGAGIGGFVDGILIHQLLQWHHMLSNRLPPVSLVNVEVNMFWDGLFHAFTWLLTALGVAMLWRAGQRPDVPWSTRTFVGALALGWGIFNVAEGLIDHHLLQLHHVKPGPTQAAWDLGFLALGALLLLGGWRLVRAGRHEMRPRGMPLRRAPVG